MAGYPEEAMAGKGKRKGFGKFGMGKFSSKQGIPKGKGKDKGKGRGKGKGGKGSFGAYEQPPVPWRVAGASAIATAAVEQTAAQSAPAAEPASQNNLMANMVTEQPAVNGHQGAWHSSNWFIPHAQAITEIPSHEFNHDWKNATRIGESKVPAPGSRVPSSNSEEDERYWARLESNRIHGHYPHEFHPGRDRRRNYLVDLNYQRYWRNTEETSMEQVLQWNEGTARTLV